MGSGEVQGTPDTLTVNASIEFTAPDVTAAMNQTSDRQQAVINALTNSGIDQATSAPRNVTPAATVRRAATTRRSSDIRPTIRSTVKIRNLDSASQTLALIGTTGGDATRINSVSYSIEDDSQLVKDARTRAFDDAKDRAEQYAQLAGLTLGKVISISEVGWRDAAPAPADTDAEGGHGGRSAGAGPADRQLLGDGDLGADLRAQSAGAISTGMPLSTAVPDSGSSRLPSLSWLTLTPGWPAATPSRVPPRS